MIIIHIRKNSHKIDLIVKDLKRKYTQNALLSIV